MRTKDEVINGFLERHTPEGQVIRSELNGVWDSGYQAGLRYNEKKLEIETTRQYNKGYLNGLKEAQDQGYQNGYDKGADDARYVLWHTIKKLYLNPDEDGISAMDVMGIFGAHHIFSDILRNYTPEEVIEKVKSYEESKKSAPTNRDKFEELFHEQFPRLWYSYQIAKNGYTSDNGFFIPDSWLDKPYKALWLDKPYEEPADGN